MKAMITRIKSGEVAMGLENSKCADNENILIFPHTIGNITFRNRDELIEWVENAQTIFQKSDNWAHIIPHE